MLNRQNKLFSYRTSSSSSLLSSYFFSTSLTRSNFLWSLCNVGYVIHVVVGISVKTLLFFLFYVYLIIYYNSLTSIKRIHIVILTVIHSFTGIKNLYVWLHKFPFHILANLNEILWSRFFPHPYTYFLKNILPSNNLDLLPIHPRYFHKRQENT